MRLGNPCGSLFIVLAFLSGRSCDSLRAFRRIGCVSCVSTNRAHAFFCLHRLVRNQGLGVRVDCAAIYRVPAQRSAAQSVS